MSGPPQPRGAAAAINADFATSVLSGLGWPQKRLEAKYF